MKVVHILFYLISFFLLIGNIYSQQPNIIVIITDDQSFNSIGYAGGDVYTPCIDSLAAEGIKFTNAHVPSTVCSPSRYSLLTGKYSGRCYAEKFMNKFPQGTPTRVENNVELRKDEPHLGSILKENGYKTAFVGKSHIMEHAMLNTANWPTYGMQTYDQSADPYDPEVDTKMKHNHRVMQEIVKGYGFDFADGIYMANVKELSNDALNVHNLEWQVDKALKFIEAEKDNPFFLYFSTTLHHGPVPWGKKDGKYWSSLDADPKLTGEGVVDTTWDFMPERQEIKAKVLQEGFPENTAYALLLDEGIKAIYQKVTDAGLENNTLIIFMPDHGSWRHGKATLHDYGTKVPMFMFWKDSISSGTEYSGLVQSIDFAPTILDVAGIEFEGDTLFDGMNLKHILQSGEGSANESLFAELGYARSAKTKKWKYIAVRYPEDVQKEIDSGETWTGFDGGIIELPYLTVNKHLGHFASLQNPHYFETDQLYDLEADPEETVNLYAIYPDVVLQMKKLLSGYLLDFKNRPFGEFTRDTSSAPHRATFPVPRSGREVSYNNLVIKWTSEAGAVSHDVYFGTTDPPALIGNQDSIGYVPGAIQPDTKYYWRIDEKNNYGTTQGDLWSFTTKPYTIPNMAPLATVSVSSAYHLYPKENLVDGIYAGSASGEWISDREETPWAQLDWDTSVKTGKIILYDLSNSTNITAGELTFSDSSSIITGALPDDGSAHEITFDEKSISWVRFQITGGNSLRQGMGEIEVYGIYDSETSMNENELHILPSEYLLGQNYPNPFNPTTKISYALPESGFVQLNVYDLLGAEVVRLVNEHKTAGKYTVDFHAKNLPSGIYLYKMKTSTGFVDTKKLVLLK